MQSNYVSNVYIIYMIQGQIKGIGSLRHSEPVKLGAYTSVIESLLITINRHWLSKLPCKYKALQTLGAWKIAPVPFLLSDPD